MRSPEFSVILPVLNEGRQLPYTLKPILPYLDDGSTEVLIIDGGSTDGTVEYASAHEKVTVYSSERGRAMQMNCGAEKATGSIFLFLHADSLLPANWQDAMRETLKPGTAMGAFRFRLTGSHPAARLIELGVRLRNRFLHLPYGDQGFFMHRRHFEHLGGFSSIPLMEDVDFVKRAKAVGTIRTAPSAIQTSNRKWERDGYMKRSLLNLRLLADYLRGRNIHAISRRYEANRAGVILFARTPSKGRVKTRLAETIGAGKALDLYTRMVRHTVQEAMDTRTAHRIEICVDRLDSAFTYRDTLGPGFHLTEQVPGDLGQRMAAGFQRLFSDGYNRIVITGTDCPELDAAVLDRALARLRGHDAVIGPTFDGGYYLIGLSRPASFIFSDMPWSTDRVFTETIERMKTADMDVSILPTLSDIDTEDDLARLRGTCAWLTCD